MLPIEYPAFSVLRETICATSTARPIVRPLALMFTTGRFASWISVEVTYAISGFLPMYMVSLVSADMIHEAFQDNLNLRLDFPAKREFL